MADADLTYDFDEIPRFVEELDDGRRARDGRPDGQHPPGRDAVAAPLRRQPGADRHAQPLLPHRRPRRALRHARACGATSCRALDLRTTGMEFASEMVIRASKEKLDIREFPIEYHPRGGESKLSSFRDGWRHLRFLLVHSPTHLFMRPGRRAARAGRADRADGRCTQIDVFGRAWDLHTMVAGALLMIVGTQVVALGPLRARLRHVLHGREGPVVRPHARALPARARAACSAARSLAVGFAIAAAIVVTWIDRGFGAAVRGAPRGARGGARSSSACRSSSRRSCSASSACAAAAERSPRGMVFATSVLDDAAAWVGLPARRRASLPRASGCWRSGSRAPALPAGAAVPTGFCAERRARCCRATRSAPAGCSQPSCWSPARSPGFVLARRELRERLRPGPRRRPRWPSSRSISPPCVLTGGWTWGGLQLPQRHAVQIILADQLSTRGVDARAGAAEHARRCRSDVLPGERLPARDARAPRRDSPRCSAPASTSSTRATSRCSP